MRFAPILVIDDDVDTRELIADVLRGEGYPVATATEGEEALAWVHVHGAPSLLLLDLTMPGMGGAELLVRRASHALLQTVPVLLMSGREPTPAARAAVDGVLRKPFDLEVMIRLIAQLVPVEPLLSNTA